MLENGKWIYTDRVESSACPLFARVVKAEKPLKCATIYMTALGMYTVYVNGQRADDRLFAPGFTSYRHRLLYQKYDLTHFFRQGINDLEILCANGWAVGYLGRGNTNHIFADHISVIAELQLEYEDGTTETVQTDEDWLVYQSRILYSELYHGEWVDYTASSGFLGNAQIDASKKIRLELQTSPPVREVERVAAQRVLISPKGERIIDFGQNLAGYVEIAVKGSRGARVTISHAEVLDREGNFYTKNLELAVCKNTYILSGEEDILKPTFTYQGYRYIRLDEWPFETVDLSAFTSVAVHSEMERTGSFLCGHTKVNQLYRNMLWGQRSNFVDIPTDCPQRDERLGWSGDIQVFLRTAAMNYRVDGFMRKWLSDMMLEQEESGAVGSVVPKVPGRGERISAAWGDAAVICPWELYLAYGDLSVLEQFFPMMQKWIAYVRSFGEEEDLWLGGFHYGDWLASDIAMCPEIREGATQTDLIAGAYFYYTVSLMCHVCECLHQDSSFYEALRSRIKQAFRSHFMKNGVPVLYPAYDALSTVREVRGMTQTSLVLILKFGLYEGDDERKALVRALLRMIEENGGKMSTGFVGTPYLLHALSENGEIRAAYNLFLQEENPSWLYSVNRGATTVWEHWDGIRDDGSFWADCKNSFNHYAYGSVFDWVYGVVLGIRVQPDGAGYRKVRIEPHTDRRLQFASGGILTNMGELEVAWYYESDYIRYEITLPSGCEADIALQDGKCYHKSGGQYTFYTAITPEEAEKTS